MENKKFKEMVSALEKVAGENKRVTGSFLEKLEIVTESLIEIIKENDLEDNLERFDFGSFGFRLAGSQHGKYIHFSSLNYDYFKLLPTNTTNIGTDFYYHNDFNYQYEYMSREEVLEAAKILPEFIQNMITKIGNLTEDQMVKMQNLVIE